MTMVFFSMMTMVFNSFMTMVFFYVDKERSNIIQASFRVSVFLCPRHSNNGGGALSVTPVRASVRPLSKFGVRSITFEKLHRFNLNLVC